MRVMGRRSETRDGLRNRLEFFFLTHFRWLFWYPVQAIGFLRSFVNRLLINPAIGKTRTRPYALSTKSPYTSWDSLTDRTYSGRHLPPATPKGGALPPVEEVVELFRRPAGGMVESEKSTVLFSYFAQWFTDGFLRTDYRKPLKNTSNHDIDLSNLYGLRAESHEHPAVARGREAQSLRSSMVKSTPPSIIETAARIRSSSPCR